MPSASPPASGTHPVTVTERVFTEQLPPLPPVPATAAHPASDARPAPGRPAVVAQLAGLWGEHDIAAALVWADELRGDDRSIAAETILRKVAESDPAGALAVAEHFGVGLHDGQAERILQLWAEAQPDEAISWMLARPAGPMRERLAVRLAWVRAQSDPADAVALTAALLPAGLHRDDAWLAIVRHWSARDPAGATAWVAGFPDGAVRDQAIELLSRPLITTGDAPR